MTTTRSLRNPRSTGTATRIAARRAPSWPTFPGDGKEGEFEAASSDQEEERLNQEARAALVRDMSQGEAKNLLDR